MKLDSHLIHRLGKTSDLLRIEGGQPVLKVTPRKGLDPPSNLLDGAIAAKIAISRPPTAIFIWILLMALSMGVRGREALTTPMIFESLLSGTPTYIRFFWRVALNLEDTPMWPVKA
jgi:hypothetical protein